jgi:hypothetical protein
MTENEKLVRDETEAIECLKSNKPTSGYLMLQESIDMAIKALEEIQKYRAIGTVEECRVAVEKQTARKGIREKIKKGYNRGMHHYYCPVCYEKGDLRNKYNVGSYCSDCGQKLDWSDKE